MDCPTFKHPINSNGSELVLNLNLPMVSGLYLGGKTAKFQSLPDPTALREVAGSSDVWENISLVESTGYFQQTLCFIFFPIGFSI